MESVETKGRSDLTSRVTIRPLVGIEDYEACIQLQRDTWGLEFTGCIPRNVLMIVAQEAGGVLVGAFDERRLVGFVLGMAGIRDRKPIHWSQMLAVAPDYRSVRKVLAAYSGSPESAKALKRFVQTRLWADITLKIVCFDRSAEEAEELLADASGYCRLHGYDAQVEHLPGSPIKGLLAHAGDWKADLIVMGSSSRARIFQHLLGDTTLHAVRHAEIPLYLTQ